MRRWSVTIVVLILTGCSGNAVMVTSADNQKATITSLAPLAGGPGDEITVKGTNLSGELTASVGSGTAALEIIDASTARFVIPQDLPEGIVTVSIIREDAKLAELPLFNKNSEHPLPSSKLGADKICDTTLLLNAEGHLERGQRHCGQRKVCSQDGDVDCLVQSQGASAAKQGLAAKILSGEVVAGIEGTALHEVSDCVADGDGGCKVDGTHFKAARMQGVAASDLRQGVVVAGLTGTISGAPALCAADGDTNCRTLPDFPAIDRGGVLNPALAFMRASFSVAGSSGQLPNCSHDGETDCVALGPSYAAAATSGIASKILLGQTVATVDGAAAIRPADCSSDAETSCTAVSAFPAVKKADLITKAGLYQTSLSLAGVPGALASCTSDGQAACLTNNSYPAVDKTALQTKTSKIKSAVTFAGVNGSLADCSLDGGTNCVAVTNFPAALKSGAAAKIAASQTLAGVTGTGATKPSDCALDGQTNCTAVNAYPAMLAAGSASKILTGETVGGVTGSAPIRPADCAADGGTNCVAVVGYPAFQATNLTTHLNKISNSVTIAGQTGTLANCADGDFGCRAVSPNFAAAATTGLAPKIVSGQTLAGTLGTGSIKPGDCAVDGAVGCVAVTNFPAAEAAIIAARTIDTATLANTHGTAATPRPADCTTEAATGCVSVTAFPAMKVAGAAPKISTGQTVGGVAGTGAVRPANCAADNDTECVTVANYPAVEKAHVQASLGKIGAGLSIAGLSGSLANCSVDGATACIATAANPAAQVVGAAPKILTGQSVAGVAGSAANTPASCATSGDTACVTSTGYPSISKTTLTSSANKMKSTLTLLGVTGSLMDCSADGQTSCTATGSYPAAATSGAAAKIMSLQTLAGIAGSAAVKPADCSADGAVDCVTINAFPAVDKSTVAAAKIRRNTSIAGVAGTLDDCTTDGGTDCVTVAAYPAALASGAAAKIMTSQTLAGISGSAIAKPGDCSAENTTGCVAVTAYPAISTTALTAAASSLRSGTSILSTAGSLVDCNSDGGTDCVTSASYASALASGAAAKIVIPNTLAGITGTAPARPADCSTENQASCVTVSLYPSLKQSSVDAAKLRSGTSIAGISGTIADCSADAQTGCVSVTSFPSVLKSNIAEGLVKSGVTIAGVTGQYPSSTYTLPGATASTADDLTDATDFNSRIKSSATFEYFDAAGNRYTQAGDTNLTAANIKSGVTIFGVTGSYSAASSCSSDGGTGCLVTSPWKAADTTGLTYAHVRFGVTLAGVVGGLAFPANGVTISTYNRTTGTGASSSIDVYDTVDDYNNNTSTFPGNYASISVLPALTGFIWTRDTVTDTDGDGTCNGSETCVYLDTYTNTKWRYVSTAGTLSTALMNCSTSAGGGFAGGRVPTQKELLQAYIDGIYYVAPKMGYTINNYVWSPTAVRADTSKAWIVALTNGHAIGAATTASYTYFCVQEN